MKNVSFVDFVTLTIVFTSLCTGCEIRVNLCGYNDISRQTFSKSRMALSNYFFANFSCSKNNYSITKADENNNINTQLQKILCIVTDFSKIKYKLWRKCCILNKYMFVF